MIRYTKNGMSPSGKAVGSGPTIRGFESLHPSQMHYKEVRKAKLFEQIEENEIIRACSNYFSF